MAKPAEKKNSWEPWVNNILKDEKNVKGAGLFDIATGAPWCAKGCDATKEQAAAIAKGIKDPSLFTTPDDAKRIPILCGAAAPNKFLFLKCADGELVARKGPTTLIAKCSKKAVVITLTKDGANPGNVLTHANCVAELVKKNF